MPVYDYLCPNCHHKVDDEFVHKHDENVKCKRCSALMKKLFPSSAKFIAAKVFPSEGIFLEHVEPGGRTFHSEKEMRDYERKTGTTIARIH